MFKSNKTVCIVGVFPPPTHGFAFVNDAMKNLIVNIDPKSSIFDLSSISLSRNISNISIRFFKFLFIYPKYLLFSFLNKYHTLYIGLSGGFGQFYDLLILSIARVTRQNIFIHHHSFSYLNKINLLTYLVIWMSGRNATHLVLCNLMQEKLRVYRKNLSCILLSNSVFLINNNADIFTHRQLKTIGFLGNISTKKGIKIFFNVLENLNIQRSVNGIIGGPFQDSKSEIFTRNELKRFSFISYLGPIYNNDKEKFFNTIDVLLMPSVLEEAEPLVIHEAMSYGIPVIAYNKGCIKEILKQNSGIVVELNLNFINYAVKLINNWINNPKIFHLIKTNSHNRYIRTKNKSKMTLENIISQITNTSSN